MSVPVRVRFAPSPTGNPHVGLVRTALFNWAFARHHHGTLVLRIEDTDAARDSEASYEALLEALHWLGLDWDEGPEIGGPYGPYRQSERLPIYADVAARLKAAGLAYECYCSQEESAARAKAAGRPPGYDNHCRGLAAEQRAAMVALGRPAVLRLQMPDEPTTFNDLVRGEITVSPEAYPDYPIVRSDGSPLYPLTNPVDDALMGITHVLRGEDLLSSTPRQLALYRALATVGVGPGGRPQFGHLPYVMGEGNKKLSKRDPEASLQLYRDRGFLPEGLLNYLALLGWSIAADRDIFTLEEMAAAFDVAKVQASPARFDLKKCEAINATRLRGLAPEDFVDRVTEVLQRAALVASPPTPEQMGRLRAACPLVQERMVVLSEAVGMLGFLFVDDDDFVPDHEAAAKTLLGEVVPTLAAAYDALAGLDDWRTERIEAVLREALVEKMGLKPKNAFAPLRVAVTGRTVAPPLFESMEVLGRQSTMSRLREALSDIRGC